MAAAVPTEETSQVSKLYSSLPLPPESRCIRVLDIYPASDTEIDELIKADIRVVDLESQPSFSALSYVWGTEAELRTILCGSSTLNVTPNCHSALRSLRRLFGRLTIWIDAICINQKDELEKTQQIPLMGQIFSSAEVVYIWLGDGNVQSDKAIAYLDRAGLLEYFTPEDPSPRGSSKNSRVWAAVWSLLTSPLDVKTHQLPINGLTVRQRLVNFLHIKVIPKTSFTTFDDIDDLLHREWIRRIWTYQEVLLASNPVIVCGGSCLQWSRLLWSLLFLNSPNVQVRASSTQRSSILAWRKVALSWLHMWTTPNANELVDHNLPGVGQSKFAIFTSYNNFIFDVFERYNVICIIGYSLMVCSPFMITAAFPMIPKGSATPVLVLLCVAILICYITFPIGHYNTPFINALDRLVVKHRPLCFTDRVLEYDKKMYRENIIDAIVSRKAKDPRDKSFAIHAILQKLSSEIPPAPDYNAPIEQIYKELCLQLMRTTRSDKALRVAALTSYPGQPSWVPDWSKESTAFWRNDPPLVTGKTMTIQGLRPLQASHPSKNDTIIARGRPFHTISSCFEFRTVSLDYQDSEVQLHLENISGLLAIFKRSTASIEFLVTVLVDYYEDRAEPFSPHLVQLSNLSNFLHTLRWLSPSDVLSLFRSGTLLNYWLRMCFEPYHKMWHIIQCRNFSTLFRICIMVCNVLATLKYKVFVVEETVHRVRFERFRTFTGSHKERLVRERLWGICTNDSQAGDRIIWFAGLVSPIVTRTDGDSIKLISPAILGRIDLNNGILNNGNRIGVGGGEWRLPLPIHDLGEYEEQDFIIS